MRRVSLPATELSAGLQAFLLALPLCLGIAAASGVPPAAGVLTAIVGGLIGGLVGGAAGTIKGPAAGLIVIVAGAVAAFGGGVDGYRGLLAVTMVAGLVQVVLAGLRAGRLLRFVPPAVVQGMLAAIGVIIIIKQLGPMIGIDAGSGGVIASIGQLVVEAPHVAPAVIGISAATGLVLVLHGRLPERMSRWLPGPLAAVVVGVIVAWAVGLPRHLEAGLEPYLAMPSSLAAALVTPDFAVLARPAAWWWVALLCAVASLESLLTVRAVDSWLGTESDLDADLRATGIANAAVALVGGLPMISEVVRSRACVSAGGRGRGANAVHGALLLLALAFFGSALRWIPAAALAVLLVVVGAKLASPTTLRQEVARGYDQLIIFGVTAIGCLATNLLLGIAMGISAKLTLHRLHGATLRSLLSPDFAAEDGDGEVRTIRLRDAAVFSSFHPVRTAILKAREEGRSVTLDLSEARLVDHTIMTELGRLEGEGVAVTGLERLQALGPDASATRVARPLPLLARLTAPAAPDSDHAVAGHG